MNRSVQLAIAAAVLAILCAVIAAFSVMGKAEPPLAEAPAKTASDTPAPARSPEPAHAPSGSTQTTGSHPDESQADEGAADGADQEGDTAADTAAEAEELRGEAVPDRSIWPADMDGVKGAVGESLPGIVECYEGWLEQNPDLQGRVAVTFSITPGEHEDDLASISAAEIDESTLGHTFMEGCVLSVMEELRFEATDGLTVTYPFIFKNEDE